MPAAKTSMTIIRPPQRGQGQGRTRGSSAAAAFSCSGSTTRDARGSTEQLACACDVGGTMGAGEQAIMADTVEAFGQHVREESPDELVGVQCHRLPAFGSVNAVVLPAKGDGVVVGCNQTTIGDGDAVGIAGQIAQHLLGPSKRFLAVERPIRSCAAVPGTA